MNRLEIDWTRCDGHGLCATLLPDEVLLDEWGFPVLRGRDITRGELTNARRAVLACPALALHLAGGGKVIRKASERTVPAAHQ